MKGRKFDIKKFCRLAFIVFACLAATSAYAQYEGYTGVLEQDSLALVAFYHATDGPNWKSNQDGFSISDLVEDVEEEYTKHTHLGLGKWLEGPVKNWFGVKVEEVDGVWRVVWLWPVVGRRENGQNKLSGYVPKEIGYLTALKVFRVNGNNGLAGTELPDEVYHPSLERIDVEKCEFGGIISDAFRKCTKIEYINLRYNQFDYIPTLDFISEEQLLNNFTADGKDNTSIIFLYSTRLSFAQIEPTIDYFYTLSDIAGKFRIEARDCDEVGVEKEIIAAKGSKVTLENNDMGKQGKGFWYRKGFNTYITGNTFTIASLSDADTGYYHVRTENDYVKSYDQNTNYGTVKTKKMYVRYTPVAPKCSGAETSYNGRDVILTFTKPMDVPEEGQAASFTVKHNGADIAVAGIKRSGRLNKKLVLTLEEPIEFGENITIAYNPGSIACENGGKLPSFNNLAATNFTRQNAPVPVSAITRTDGAGIYVTFDQFIDTASFSVSGFTLHSKTENMVTTILPVQDESGKGFSKTILLAVGNIIIDSTDNLSVSYKKGTLNAAFGTAVKPFDSLKIENTVNVETTPLTLVFEDGLNKVDSVIVKSDIKLLPFPLYDDGTHGDTLANDGIWMSVLDVVDGDYYWEAYELKAQIKYDTVKNVDENTGLTTIVINPYKKYYDSLLTAHDTLTLSIADDKIVGDTYAGIRNCELVFILDLKDYVLNNNPDTLLPYLLGLNNDWTVGAEMLTFTSTPTDSSQYDYILNVGGFTKFDSINFNFRNGDEWENSSPHKRYHIVNKELDTINAEFGEYETLNSSFAKENQGPSIYPNPARDIIHVRTEQGYEIEKVEIINLFGQTVLHAYTPDKAIQIGHLANGYYLIRITDKNKSSFTNKFLKTE